MGFLEILTLIFVVCKLIGVISWSWWLVLSPLWIAIALYVVILIVYVVLAIIGYREINKRL